MSSQKIDLVVPSSKWLRLDTLPFLAIYSLTLYWACLVVEEDIYARLVVLGVLLLHLLTYLLSHWSTSFKMMNEYSRVSSID